MIELTSDEIQAKIEQYCYRRDKYFSATDINNMIDEDFELPYIAEHEGRWYNKTTSTYDIKPQQCQYCHKMCYKTQVLTKNIKTGQTSCNICRETKRK